MSNQANTAQGSTVEHLFAETILERPRALDAILKSIGYDSIPAGMKAGVVGGNRRKGDVEMVSDDAPTIRVSVHSFKSAGYNQIRRRNLIDFCRDNQINSADTAFLKHIWLRKAMRGGVGVLVQKDEEARVRDIFSSIEPIRSALLGNDYPQIFASYSVINRTWHLYNMEQQVLPRVINREVSFTRVSNIQMGRYIVIQRKGAQKGEGDGHPLDIDYGPNHVQIKMRVKKFWHEVEPISGYRIL